MGICFSWAEILVMKTEKTKFSKKRVEKRIDFCIEKGFTQLGSYLIFLMGCENSDGKKIKINLNFSFRNYFLKIFQCTNLLFGHFGFYNLENFIGDKWIFNIDFIFLMSVCNFYFHLNIYDGDSNLWTTKIFSQTSTTTTTSTNIIMS